MTAPRKRRNPDQRDMFYPFSRVRVINAQPWNEDACYTDHVASHVNSAMPQTMIGGPNVEICGMRSASKELWDWMLDVEHDLDEAGRHWLWIRIITQDGKKGRTIYRGPVEYIFDPLQARVATDAAEAGEDVP